MAGFESAAWAMRFYLQQSPKPTSSGHTWGVAKFRGTETMYTSLRALYYLTI